MSDTMRGDQALALGALAAGVKYVTGYPGAPATGVFDALLRLTQPDALQMHWAANEKVAVEQALGASLAGSRALVILKSVGLNIALDPLATLSYTGCAAGLVILLGDDPGGWSSQNEQDSRWLARVAELPLVEPTSVQQAAALMAQAYVWSEALGLPFIVRITRSLVAASAEADEPYRLPPAVGCYIRPRGPWVTYPPRVLALHRALHRRLRQVREAFESSPFDDVSADGGACGVLAVGHLHSQVGALLANASPAEMALFGLASVWPLPTARLQRWLADRQRVLVLEQGGPFVEEALRALAQRLAPDVTILGRHDRVIPQEDELFAADIVRGLAALDPALQLPASDSAQPALLASKPLCEDCLYWPVFRALLQAVDDHGGRARHLIVGEPGCMVRAMQPPLELFDVKYSMGAGLGLGLGLAVCEPQRHTIAILGDSSFLHSGINAVAEAVQRDPRLLVIILDNQTTGLTGGQPHMGSPTDERGQPRPALDLARLLTAMGARVADCAARDEPLLRHTFDEALASDGLRVIIARAPCPRYVDSGTAK